MTRIIAGRFGGRRLRTPDGRETRPTSDRVREALFSALEARTELAGARFVDLYAGSGAVGLEAVSRGASHALLVEHDSGAARVARHNIRDLGVTSEVALVVDRVARVVGKPADQPYQIVFADPPYAVPDAEITDVLLALGDGGWLAEDAVVVVERSRRSAPLTWVPCITADGMRRYGETSLWYGRRS